MHDIMIRAIFYDIFIYQRRHCVKLKLSKFKTVLITKCLNKAI